MLDRISRFEPESGLFVKKAFKPINKISADSLFMDSVRIFSVFIMPLLLILTFIFLLPGIFCRVHDSYVMNYGIRSTATVLDSRELGVDSADDPIFRLVLKVAAYDGSTFKVVLMTAIPQNTNDMYGAGDMIFIKYSPRSHYVVLDP
jgi:hypothetical protein